MPPWLSLTLSRRNGSWKLLNAISWFVIVSCNHVSVREVTSKLDNYCSVISTLCKRLCTLKWNNEKLPSKIGKSGWGSFAWIIALRSWIFFTSPDKYKIITRFTKNSKKLKRLTPFNLSNQQWCKPIRALFLLKKHRLVLGIIASPRRF